MATQKITKTAVDSANTGFLWDDEVMGFGLRVTTGGAKSYVFQYRMGGRGVAARRFTIGRHGTWTPDDARKEAKRLAQMADRGIDPGDDKRERQRIAVDLAFDSYVGTFADSYLKGRWKRWTDTKSMLERDAVAVLKKKPLPDIKRSDLNAVFDRLTDRPALARLMHATLRKLFRWAVSRGDLERSPLEGVEPPAAIKSRDRVLTDAELAFAWKGAEKLVTNEKGFYRLLIATGQRREEVSGLKWSEIDRAAKLWTLPADRAKNGVTSLIPLNVLALEALDAIASGEKWPKRGFIFPSTGKGPFSGFSKAKVKLDAEIAALVREGKAPPIPAWRVHDIRRTVATGLQRLGVRFEVTEAVLNHVSGSRSGIAGIYQRHDWKEEKREALDAWGGHVAALIASNG